MKPPPMDNESNDGPDAFYMGDADVSQVIPIPEPATLAVLLLTGSLFLLARRKKA